MDNDFSELEMSFGLSTLKSKTNYDRSNMHKSRSQSHMDQSKSRSITPIDLEKSENNVKNVKKLEKNISQLRSNLDFNLDTNQRQNMDNLQLEERVMVRETKEFLEKSSNFKKKYADDNKPKNHTAPSKRNLGVFFGHANWNLMLNMLIGIRTSLKKLISKKSICAADYQ